MATLTDLLAEASSAYHDLLIGKTVGSARDQNGEEVRYTQADATMLLSYIQSLQAQVASAANLPSTIIGPMRTLY